MKVLICGISAWNFAGVETIVAENELVAVWHWWRAVCHEVEGEIKEIGGGEVDICRGGTVEHRALEDVVLPIHCHKIIRV